MNLVRLELEEFRQYRKLVIDLDPAGLRVAGANGSGKSTLVEAVAVLATMRSPRSGSDRELMHFKSGQELGFPPYARAIGRVHTLDGEVEIEIGLQVDSAGERTLKKSVKVNGKPTRAIDAVGRLKIVLFAPEDVTLVSGPPSGRRRYLDLFISQIDRRYLRSLSRYGRIVEQRNSLLKSLLKEGRQAGSSAATSQLAFWNDELITYGAYIVARRRIIAAGLAGRAATRFAEFSVGGELGIAYAGSVGQEIGDDALRAGDAELARERIQRAFEQRLSEVRGDELRRGVSLVGPHRDDFSVTLNGMEIGPYGSRGQQRLAVVALKLAEADLMLAESGELPVVLLDDVLSELDATHRERLLSSVAEMGAQLIVTSTDRGLIDQASLSAIPAAIVTPGAITFE